MTAVVAASASAERVNALCAIALVQRAVSQPLILHAVQVPAAALTRVQARLLRMSQRPTVVLVANASRAATAVTAMSAFAKRVPARRAAASP